MVWGEGQAQRNYITDSMTRTHTDIETMTRRLELEKRRLQRIEKELTAARNRGSGKQQRTPPPQPRELSTQSSEIGRTNSMSQGRPPSARESSRTLSSTEVVVPAAAVGGGSTASTAVAGPIRALVNRLDVQRKKLDSMDHENSVLRQEVDAIRQNRLQLNTIFERLRVEIKQRSAQLADFVEETAASRTVQGDAIQRVDVMKRHRELERRQFKQEVMRLREQLKLQDWERKEVEVQLKRADTGVQTKKDLIVPDEENLFSETDMMRRIMKTALFNCIQRRKIKHHQKKIEVFDQAFSTIRQSTGIEHIEEIVKIFVNLEGRNFSLLTYVNVMNREIEALEGVRRDRQRKQEEKLEDEQRYEGARQQALAEMSRQLQSSQLAIEEGQQAVSQHRELIEELCPILEEIGHGLEAEFDKLSKAGASPPEELLRFPGELREETIPEWLELVEIGMGRFRDLLPGSAREKDGAFPCTALSSVKSLQPKRHGKEGVLQPLVKQQELPSSYIVSVDEQGSPGAKRLGVPLTPAHKATIDFTHDEESDEENYDHRPLDFKDLQEKAKHRLSKNKRHGRGNNREATLSSSSPLRTRERTGSSDGVMFGASDSIISKGAKEASGHFARAQRSSIGEEALALEKQKRGERSDNGSGALDDKERGSLNGETPKEPSPQLHGASDDKGAASSAASRRLGRGNLTGQAASSSAIHVTEDDVDKCFLQRYKMTREELQVMADHMGIHIHNLCFLKQEFDIFDQDQSGYIDISELKSFLKKLGEDLSDEALNEAFKQLDRDGSEEVEFFEFCEWFTSPES